MSISRASGTITFPAKFTAAMRPSSARGCRLDIHVEVPRVPFEKLSADLAEENEGHPLHLAQAL